MNLVLAAAEGVGLAGAHAAPGGSPIDYAWLIPVVPAVSALLLMLFGKRLGALAAWIAIAAMTVSAVVATLVFAFLNGQPEESRVFVRTLVTWIDVPPLVVDWAMLIDPLAAVMLLLVTWVGLLIHIYSVGYMRGDERYHLFFAYLNLFAASMLVLVTGAGFLTLFVGWELVGLCSYLLIGFWFEKRAYAGAATKAFVVNRVGDVGFMIAMFVIFAAFGSLAFTDVLAVPGDTLTTGAAVAITLLLFAAATGKSAQIPLFVWLPDAMAGPTPVSALIHAATMVTAGVYLIARASPIYALVPGVGLFVAWVGILTALVAAFTALAQNDIKRILAYSTVSQLGFMIVGVGLGDAVAGVFHLLTHGFFKALLFLAAGSVMHALADATDVWRMGGLRKVMPITFATSAVAWLAISGVWPLSGFFSKEEILAAAAHTPGAEGIWVLGAFTAGLTAFYMSRWFFLIFLNPPRWDAGVHAHESPLTMTLPLVVLAVASALGGLINIDPERGFLHHWLEPSVVRYAGDTPFMAEALSIAIVVVVSLAGIVYAWLRYVRVSREDLEQMSLRAHLPTGPAHLAAGAFYVDRGYDVAVAAPGRMAARAMATIDRVVIDGAVNGTGRVTTWAARRGRVAQTGFVRSYALATLLGAVLIVVLFIGSIAIGQVD